MPRTVQNATRCQGFAWAVHPGRENSRLTGGLPAACQRAPPRADHRAGPALGTRRPVDHRWRTVNTDLDPDL
jgi:hypothetical protein